MNQKTYVNLEIEKNGKVYIFSIPFGSSYQESYDAAAEIAQGIVELSNQAKEAQEKAKAEAEADV